MYAHPPRAHSVDIDTDQAAVLLHGVENRAPVQEPALETLLVPRHWTKQRSLKVLGDRRELQVGNHRVGSLQEGKDADLIILDGHPFHYSTLVDLTIVNGKVLYDRSKSLYGPWLSHALVDAAIFVVGYQMVKGHLA